MKISIFYYTVLLCLMVSCSDSDETDPNPGNGGSGQKMPLTLTPIGDLNQGTVAINSHKDFTSRSSLMMNHRSYVEIGTDQVKVDAPVYPRVRKMEDGRYILFYQNNQIGADSYYVVSSDLKTWVGGDRVFARHAITDHSGAANERRFSTCNALVLDNGDII